MPRGTRGTTQPKRKGPFPGPPGNSTQKARQPAPAHCQRHTQKQTNNNLTHPTHPTHPAPCLPTTQTAKPPPKTPTIEVKTHPGGIPCQKS